MTNQIILASQSRHRAELLKNAGIDFTAISADIDEREVEAPLLASQMPASDIAEVLAIAKALDISKDNMGSYVIGCDQTLSLEGELFHKPENMEEAQRRLLALSGKTHQLNSAVVLAHENQIIWNHMEVANITFRDLDPGFIGRHVSQAGEGILSSVGAYQIEGLGVQLFKKVEGDYFSIIGLPLLPLLAKLRDLKLLEYR